MRTKKTSPHSKARITALLLVLFISWAQAQPQSSSPPGLVLNHFSVAVEHYEAPHEAQIKTLLEGASAEQVQPGHYLVHQPKLQTFSEDGRTNTIIQAPECVYNAAGKTVDSSGPLQAQTGDGKFTITGQGFLWQTNSSLTISNDVHTWVSPVLLGSGEGAGSNSPTKGVKNIEITSRRFHYETNSSLGIYSGDVRVTGTNLAMSGGILALKIPMGMGQGLTGTLPGANELQSISADTNVAIEYNGVHVTSQHAQYFAQTGQAVLTGNPAWHTNQWAGSGDEMFLDRTNRIMRSKGHAFLRMPAQGSGGSELLLSQQQPAAVSISHTNEIIEIHSDHYEIRTNRAVFEKEVQVTELAGDQLQGTMTCQVMNALFGASNQLQELVAEKAVRINHGDQQFASEKAVYTATNETLELTQNPSWRAGLREGRGDLILVNTRTNEMDVRGNAFMRLPAGEFGQPGALPAVDAHPAATTPHPEEFAEVYSDEYSVRPESARFWGGVTVRHPQMNWACKTVSVRLPPPGGTARGMVAEQDVEFVMADTKGQEMHGMGDKAIYSFNVVSGVTNEAVTLLGYPAVLERTNCTFRNSVIVLDPAHDRVTAHGRYRMTLRPETGGTNLDIESRIPKEFRSPTNNPVKKHDGH